jgi:hypothetical protein
MRGIVRRLAIACFVCSRGFSTTEISISLLATSILTATTAPNIQELVEMARATKDANDVRVIAMALIRPADDVHIGVLNNARGYAVIVVSAGPNRIIETPFAAVGLPAAGDDVISVAAFGHAAAKMMVVLTVAQACSVDTRPLLGPMVSVRLACSRGSAAHLRVGESVNRPTRRTDASQIEVHVEVPQDKTGQGRAITLNF